MSRKEVLKSFKTLLRITQRTFNGDVRAINEARQRIFLEFRKELEAENVGERLKMAKQIGEILEKEVVQAVKNPETENYVLKLRKETAKFDNVIFKEDAIIPPSRNRKCKPS